MSDSTVLTFVLPFVVLLFVATAMSVLTKRINMPLSISLVVAGLVLGELLRSYPSLAPLGVLRLSEGILMYVFLPTLIFQAAFAMDSRLLLKNLAPVLVLAIPAVFISFAAVGYGLHWSLGLPLGTALLFGALTTATDSSAVLNLFREIGAPKRLNILVQGENLFNDAVSIVIFLLVAGAVGIGVSSVPPGSSVVLYGLREFLVTFLGGLATGVVVGLLFGKLIEVVRNDDLIEILLTTVLAYLSFLLAELVIGASGITAVVGAGLVLGGWGRTKFTPGTLDYLGRFWAYLAFVVNSLVFLLTGLAIEWRAVLDFIGPGMILIAFLLSVVARAVGIGALFPIVNALPGIERTGPRYQAAIAWGGIRGGTALALALTLPQDYAARDLVVGLTVGVVLLSLLIQGLTLDPVIRLLGLHRVTPQERYSRDEAVLRIKRAARGRIPELRRGGVISESVAGRVEQVYVREERAALERVERTRQDQLAGDDEARLLRRQMLLVEKRTYRELFHVGVLSEHVFKNLQHSIDVQIDHLRAVGQLPRWTIHSPLHWGFQRAGFRVLNTFAPAGRVVQRFRLRRIAERYEENWARVIGSGRVLRELESIAEDGAFHRETVDGALRLYRRWTENAQKRLDDVGDQFPEYAAKVQEMVALRLCLHEEDRAILDLAELDALSERDVMQMRRAIERQVAALRQKPIEELRPYPRELLAKVPSFRGLPAEVFDVIVPLLKPRALLAEEVAVREGEPGDSLFLIGRGVVRITARRAGEAEPATITTLLAGDFFGEMAVLSAALHSATATAATDCILYELRRTDLEAVLSSSPSMRRALVRASAARRRELREAAGEAEALEALEAGAAGLRGDGRE